MNKQMHRLVFDRRRGMRVPAAEHVRGVGKAAGGQTRAVAAACAAVAVTLLAQEDAQAARSLAAAMQNANAAWANRSNPGAMVPVLSESRQGENHGVFSYTKDTSGKRAVVSADTKQVIINWDSYNLASGYTLQYVLQDKGSALNKIWDLNPSVIFGSIVSNGEVILENQNAGFIFGSGARVETSRFVATALSLSKETFLRGIRNSGGDGELDSYRALGSSADTATYVDANGQTQLKGIRIERGAEIKALAGGDVLMAAPAIYNEGRIETPKGQTILAAGQKVYLMSTKADQTQRGLVVAVDAFNPVGDAPEGLNVVEQAESRAYSVDNNGQIESRVNAIVAEKGSINLVGMAIRQNGLLSATTAVKGENGEISLVASKTVAVASQYWVGMSPTGDELLTSNEYRPVAAQLGSIEFGAESRTEVMPSTDAKETQLDKDIFLRSTIEAKAADLTVRSGAQIKAPSGNIELLAAESTLDASGNPTYMLGNNGQLPTQDSSRLVIEQGAQIDVSGLRDVTLSMSRNQMANRVFKSELADQPLQRDGVLYRQTLQFDARNPINVANVKGFYEGIQRDARERSTVGGNVSIIGSGAVSVQGASINVSGGRITYEDGALKTSLLRKGDRIVTLDQAKSGDRYDELYNSTSGNGKSVAGFEQGFDAGSLTLSAGQALAMDLSGVRGDVVVGLLQRTGQRTKDEYTRSRTGPALGRPNALTDNPHLYASLRPQGFTLNIGSRFGDKGSEKPHMSQVSVGGDALPGVDLAVNQLKQSGLSTLNLAADAVNLAKEASLNLGAEGSLTVLAQNALTMDASVRAAGGAVTLKSETDTITVGEHANMDVSGELLDLQGNPTRNGDVLVVNGGKVTVSAGKSLLMAQGSAINVSAGVTRSQTGVVTKGAAGTIDLAINGDVLRTVEVSGLPPTDGAEPRSIQALPQDGLLALGGRLSGFGFDSGGTLKISGLRSVTLQNLADNGQSTSADLALDQRFFEDNGFTSFNLKSVGDIRVKSGLDFKPMVKSYVANFRAVRGAAGSVGPVVIQTLGQGLRSGVKLDLSNTGRPYWTYDKGAVQGQNEFARIHVEEGATVDVGAGGRIGLTSAGQVAVAGTLRAQGGEVALAVSGARGAVYGPSDETTKIGYDPMGYVADQGIVVAGTGKIDVSGVVKTSVLSGTRLAGDVLGGGRVTFNGGVDGAVRGRVILERGSEINVSGKKGEITMANGVNAQISRGAGSVSINTADGFVAAGTLIANRPDESVAGGQFYASVSREGKTDEYGSSLGGIAYPDVTERRIDVLAKADDITDNLKQGYGRGVIGADTLNGSGFDRVHLRADQSIGLTDGASIQAADRQPAMRSVTLNTRAIEVSGSGERLIQASHVALGDVDLMGLQGGVAVVETPSASGTTDLRVNAGLIEVHGHSAIRGAQSTTLDATLSASHQVGSRRDGEIRFVGRALSGSERNKLTGKLNFENDLTMRAGQVYATTLSDFKVEGKADQSRLTIEAPAQGSASQTPLSALAKLTLQAHDVVVKGVVRQPFGAITIRSTEGVPHLVDGSELSVSGDGVKVPVGSMVNKTQWVYKTDGINAGQAVDTTNTDVSILNGQSIDKGILVEGKGLKIDSQSNLLAQAGGDLLTWEFQAGVGGSQDALAQPNVYAVLPGYTYDFAPHDTEILNSQKLLGTTWAAGDQIEVKVDTAVLKAGRYTLLPARYALLPGAVRVSVGPAGVAGNQVVTQRDDGSVVVSGYKTNVGTQINGGNDGRLTLILESESTFRAKSDLSVTTVSDFLKQQAKKMGETVMVNPGDAGRVSLASTDSSFDWAANYNLQGKDGLAGGQFDLSMDKMVVLSKDLSLTKDQLDAGYHVVDMDALNATGADSILLGGTRHGSARKASLNEDKASSVIIGTDLAAKELIVVASGDVTVNDGVTIQAGQSNQLIDKTLNLTGNGAALMVSDQVATNITRTGSTAQGDLNFGRNVTLRGASVQMDSANQVTGAAGVLVEVDTLGVGAKKVVLGTETARPDALTLGDSALQRKELQVRAYDRIELAAGKTLGQTGAGGVPALQKLVLDAPVIAGEATAVDGQTTTIRAQSVALRNTSGSAPEASASSQATWVVETSPAIKDATAVGITLGEGQQRLAFKQVNLKSTGDVVMEGEGTLSVQKNLTIEAARVTARSGANYKLEAEKGLVHIQQADAAQARTLNDVVGSGAKLTVDALRVIQSGTVELASGHIEFNAKGDGSDLASIVFDEGSKTSVAGWQAEQNGQVVAVAPGGLITAKAESGAIEWLGELDAHVPDTGKLTQVGVAAGQVVLSTPATDGGLKVGSNASIKGQAATDALSGSLAVDAFVLRGETDTDNALGMIADKLRDGGVFREVAIRDRSDDLVLNKNLKADRVVLSADAGDLTVAANVVIDAAAERGGFVKLAAGQDLTVKSGAVIRVDSDVQSGANGGDVLLSSTNGQVRLEAGSTISAKGDDAQDGRVVVRAKAEKLQDGGQLQATVTAGEYYAEAVQAYDIVAGDAAFLQTSKVESTGKITKVEIVGKDPKNAKNLIVRTSTGDGVKIERKVVKIDPVTGLKTESVELVSFGFKDGVKPTTSDKSVVATSNPKAELKFSTPASVVTTSTIESDKVMVAAVDVFEQANTMVADKAAWMDRLGMSASGASKVDIRAGLELRSKTDINLTEDWDLSRSAHAGASPIFLTLRAQNDIHVNGWLSDGFNGVKRSETATPTSLKGEGSSFRLVAGADLLAADVMQTTALQAGSLTIAGGKGIRTTSGSIELGASDNITLQPGKNDAEAQAVVYVAGLADADSPRGTAWQQFTHHGGRLELDAGGSVIAPAALQGFGNWFLHTGSGNSDLAWASSFDAFRQGVGSMGGGNVRVEAGQDIVNLGVVAPTSGVATKANGVVTQTVANGGDILVRAGRDIKGGMMFLGKGRGVLEAGNSVTLGDARKGAKTESDAVAPVLGLMDGQWRVQARDDVKIGYIYNPTALNGTSKATKDARVSSEKSGSFVSYSDQSAVALSSAGSDVTLLSDNWRRSGADGLLDLHSLVANGDQLKSSSADSPALKLLPATLEASAFGGDVVWEGSPSALILVPSSQGSLKLYARDDVKLQRLELRMLDQAASGDMSSALKDKSVDWVKAVSTSPGGLAYVPSGLHANDLQGSSVVAGRDVLFESDSALNLAEALRLQAGRDINSPEVIVVHNDAADVSRIDAGRNLIGVFKDSHVTATESKSRGRIVLIGSGELRVSAGQSLDLRNAAGIEATGPDAKLVVSAGTAAKVDVNGLVGAFFDKDEQARQDLVAYVQSVLHVKGINYEQALAYYREMTPEHQLDFAKHQLVLPAFAREYVQPSAQTDQVWSVVAQSRGVSASNQSGPDYQAYLDAQAQLISYVKTNAGQALGADLTFDRALSLYQAMSPAKRAEFVDKRASVPVDMAMAFLAVDPKLSYTQAWADLVAKQPLGRQVAVDDYSSELFQRFVQDVVLKEVQRVGSVATAVADSSNDTFNARRKDVRQAIWAQIDHMSTLAGVSTGFDFSGDLNLAWSKVHTLGRSGIGKGGIDLWAPGGAVQVGPETATEADKKQSGFRGIATYGGGDVRSYSAGDFQVASQKVHIVGSGDMVLYSSRANIDSGRGSNTSVTLPPKNAKPDGYGGYTWEVGETTVGSGMAIFVDKSGRREGKISLLAPNGEVRALDAYVDAPTVDLAGPVLGADNFKGGVAGSTPPPAISLNLSINTGTGAETAAGQSQVAAADKAKNKRDRSSLITVDVLGMGELDAPAAGEATGSTSAASKPNNQDCDASKGNRCTK